MREGRKGREERVCESILRFPVCVDYCGIRILTGSMVQLNYWRHWEEMEGGPLMMTSVNNESRDID